LIFSSIPTAGHRSLWLQQVAGDAADTPKLEGEHTTDVAIVGGGFVGLWTAIELKLREPALDVALLEADICGSGASGRNGGFAMTWWSKIAFMPRFVGDEEAVRLARASVEGVDEIRQICSDHGVDCDFHDSGWIWAAASEAQLGAWASTMDECRRLGVTPFRALEPAEVARRTGSSVHRAGIFDPGTASVHPGKLVRGLRKIALKLGVRVYEHSPVVSLGRQSPPRLRTPDGLLTAAKVVVATNVWAGGMPEFRRYIVAISSDMVATEPIPERLAEIGWTGNECVSDSQLMIHYYRTTEDGRVAFGKGGWGVAFAGRIPRSFDRAPRRARMTEENLVRLYPMLRGVKITHDWSGAIDRSVIGLPLIGHTGGRSHIVHAIGWSANAVGPARVGAKIVASLVQERDDEWSRSALVDLPQRKFPPEPIRYAGAHLVRSGVVAKERAENSGRPPGRLSRFLAAQAPSGLIPHE
jgi:glycine/D-amino acid oxidase-like deaminating enzyme